MKIFLEVEHRQLEKVTGKPHRTSYSISVKEAV
jgi:hypothetical protein